MANPYLKYYTNQAGSGISGFQGLRYQRGHGFFGDAYDNALKPLLGYLGKLGLTTGMNLASDLVGGKDLKDSAISRLKEAGKSALDAGLKRGQKYLQTGSGIRRKRKKYTNLDLPW